MGTASVDKRDYRHAIEALNSLQSNAATIELIRKQGGKGGEQQVVESIEYLNRIGYQPNDLNALNAIHVTGTKGKGSTCAFTDSVLRCLAPEAKIGLYTSPHLVAVRERIRINGQPIAEPMFAKYFFEVWDRLEQDTKRDDPDTPVKPAYFRYLTLMAFHVFLQEKVDAAIVEVGVGGTFDSTNIIPQSMVAGVTSLGIDHVFVLGHTIEEIATQKGGIYKPDVPALAIDQPAVGLDVLRARADELGASHFHVIPVLKMLDGISLGLAGKHQRTNASLALGLIQAFRLSERLPPAFMHMAASSPHDHSLETTDTDLSLTYRPDLVLDGLMNTRWPGRCQVVQDHLAAEVKWYLDGAHTSESLECCGEWFSEASANVVQRVLIFNCTSGRSGLKLLGSLLSALSPSATRSLFDHVIFCTNTTYRGGVSKGDLTSNAVDSKDLEELTTQHELAAAWAELRSTTSHSMAETEVHVMSSIEDAVLFARGLGEAGEAGILVTGSLHLVGGVICLLEYEV